MENIEISYCRFCAESKSTDKLLNLQTDCQKHEEVLLKLAFLNAVYVDVSDKNSLPKTACLICYESLNKAYEFLQSVKQAQDVLIGLFSTSEDNKCDLSDDDQNSAFDDFLSLNESVDIKLETIAQENESLVDSVEVKVEPKEEVETINPTLDVHEIIGAALQVPFDPEMTIYAKDVSDVGTKAIKSWSQYPWICSHCNIEFINIDMLRSHSKLVHGRCSALFCVDCKIGRKDDFMAFVKHVRKHRKCLRNFCHYCDSELQGDETISSHVKQHFQKSQIACQLCGEILNDKHNLEIHLQDYSLMKPKRKPKRKPGTAITIEDLTCSICKKVYKNTNSLRDHMKLHNINRKRDYTCDRCGKMFYNKGTLTSHIMTHDKIRPHICRICNRSFLFPNMLRRHVEMHSGVKPYSCEQCGRCFRLPYQLNAHKIVHTDSMPYICQYCNKAFRFKQILKNHERQHTGSKPYSCQFCSMEFTNWSNYNKHMKRRHGTDTAKKKITPEGVFPVDPITGQIVQVEDPAGTEEWKSKIMIPGKRGKKKRVKQID